MKNEIVSEIAAAAGVTEKQAQDWIDILILKVPAKLERGLTLDEAIEEINNEGRAFFAELIENKTPRARVARSWISASTYATAGGLEYDASRDGSPSSYAFSQVLRDPDLSDIDSEVIENGAAWLLNGK